MCGDRSGKAACDWIDWERRPSCRGPSAKAAILRCRMLCRQGVSWLASYAVSVVVPADNHALHRQSEGWKEDGLYHLRLRGFSYCARLESDQSPVSVPPFCARCRAMRLDMRRVDHLRLGRSPPFRTPAEP